MIDRFVGEHEFLSNFYPSPIDGYPAVENRYQAHKTLDEDARTPFRHCSAGQSKKLGRKVRLRSDWEDVKEDVMLECLRLKFAPGSDLAAKLIATSEQKLVEGNTWGDRYWGVCKGVGENRLGVLLMQVREELQEAQL